MPVLLLAVRCASTSGAHTLSLDDQIRAVLPGLTVYFEDQARQETEQYGLRRFSYSSRLGAWPYGSGFGVWARSSRFVLWIYLHHGDFPPHEVQWADFDGDARPDLFFHSGEEHEFATHVYLNRVHSSKFGLSHFAQVYENDEVYAIVVDVDSNGQPELLVPEPFLPDADGCSEAFREFAVANSAWKNESLRATGSFSNFNFSGGLPPQEYDSLELFSKVRFVSFGPPPAAEAVQAHLRLRYAVIEEALRVLPEQCRLRAAETSKYIAELLSR